MMCVVNTKLGKSSSVRESYRFFPLVLRLKALLLFPPAGLVTSHLRHLFQ